MKGFCCMGLAALVMSIFIFSLQRGDIAKVGLGMVVAAAWLVVLVILIREYDVIKKKEK